MPALSMFFGIIVRMQSERGGKHHKAHIHAIYNDYEIVIALDGEILKCLKAGWQYMRMSWLQIGECFLMAMVILRLIL